MLLFPEGKSHNQPHQLPLKTGAARIALETEAKHGPRGLQVVPVGLTYEAKDRFGSRVLVFVGDPIPVAPFAEAYRSHARTAVRDADRAHGGRAGRGDGQPWDLGGGAPGGARGARDGGRRGALAPLLAALAGPARVRRAARRAPRSGPRARAGGGRVRPLAGRSWASTRPTWSSPASAAPGGRGWRRCWWCPGLIGVALNWLPFRLPGWLSGRLSRTPDEPATSKLLAALALFPLFWPVEAAIAAAFGGPAWGAALLVLAPATGYAALRAFSRGRPWHGPRLDVHERMLAELRTQRSRLRDALVDSTRPPGAPTR